VLVLPCQRAPDGDLDGVPVALMEALAAGRPVITTPVSGIPELVDEEVGWLVPPGSAPALAEALCAAADPAERLRRGAAGPARLHERSFTISAQVSSVLASWGEPWSRATSPS
jgi:glycosyltransferase involved in cell wall biosynthesis